MLESYSSIQPEERIITALDCGLEEALALGQALKERATWVKVGMTLFYKHGPAAVEEFKHMGFKVFLDLKLHDIPHQVRGAARSACLSGADMLTIHACGGRAMMQAACEGVEQAADELKSERPILLGITVLTSMDEQALADVGVSKALGQQVSDLAQLAYDAGLDGVVASPQEAAVLRSQLGPEAYIVTPGVRPAGAQVGDQSRVATPAAALEAGASHLVIGRPITQAENPREAFDAIASEIAK